MTKTPRSECRRFSPLSVRLFQGLLAIVLYTLVPSFARAAEPAKVGSTLNEEVRSLLDSGFTAESPIPIPPEQLGVGVTFGSIITAAEIVNAALDSIVKGALQNAINSLGAQVDRSVASANTQLSISIAQLRQVVGDKISSPIDSLGYDIQQMAIRLSNVTGTLSQLLDLQRRCLFTDLDMFVSGVTTATENLKSGFLFSKTGGPRLGYFAFDNHNKLVLPPEGGRVVFSGFDLWTEDDLKPEIQLTDASGNKTYSQLNPGRGKSKDEISAMVDGALIKQHGGECMLVKFKIHRREGLFKKQASYDLVMPMCVPDTVSTQFVMTATTHYNCITEDPEEALPMESFMEVSYDCSNTKEYGPVTRVVNTKQNCILTRVADGPGEFHRYIRQANTALTIGPPSSITVTGLIGTASCFCPPVVGCVRVFSHACFQWNVTPYVKCSTPKRKRETASTQPTVLNLPETKFTVELPKACDYENSEFEYQINRVVAGSVVPVIGAVSQPQTCNNKGPCSSKSERIPNTNITIVGDYTPGLARPTANVSVKATVGVCGY